MRPGSRLLPVAALVAAAALGGGVAIAIAAAAGALGSTTTIRELDATPPANNAPALFQQSSKRLTINAIYRRVSPGVVQLTSTRVVTQPAPLFGFDFRSLEKALGSGFVIDKAGHIVTNYHVVQGARTVQVSFSNRDSMNARLVGSDASTDIAVLQVDARSRALTPLRLGNSDAVRVGDAVVAIGNPFGYDRTVTAGIVSALQREIVAPNSFPIDHIIQTDAAINEGNSGGPLIDANGNVIGVNSQIATGGTGNGNVGIGFAIPINTVRTVVAQILKNGRVEHPFLGIGAKAITPAIADLFHLHAKHGLLVSSVEQGSGAAAAGVRAGRQQVVVSGETYSLGGDLIVAADGASVSTLDQLRDVINAKKPGDTIRLKIWRDDKELTLTAKLGRQPSSSPQG